MRPGACDVERSRGAKAPPTFKQYALAPDAPAKSRALLAYYQGILTQARIQNEAADEKMLLQLRGELSSFVCKGQYGDGMARILDSFLRGRSQPRPPLRTTPRSSR